MPWVSLGQINPHLPLEEEVGERASPVFSLHPPRPAPRAQGTVFRVVDQSRPLWEIPLGPAVSPSIAKSSGDVVLASDGRLSLWLVWRGLWCLSSGKNVSLLLGLKSVNFSF